MTEVLYSCTADGRGMIMLTKISTACRQTTNLCTVQARNFRRRAAQQNSSLSSSICSEWNSQNISAWFLLECIQRAQIHLSGKALKLLGSSHILHKEAFGKKNCKGKHTLERSFSSAGEKLESVDCVVVCCSFSSVSNCSSSAPVSAFTLALHLLLLANFLLLIERRDKSGTTDDDILLGTTTTGFRVR